MTAADRELIEDTRTLLKSGLTKKTMEAVCVNAYGLCDALEATLTRAEEAENEVARWEARRAEARKIALINPEPLDEAALKGLEATPPDDWPDWLNHLREVSARAERAEGRARQLEEALEALHAMREVAVLYERRLLLKWRQPYAEKALRAERLYRAVLAGSEENG